MKDRETQKRNLHIFRHGILRIRRREIKLQRERERESCK